MKSKIRLTIIILLVMVLTLACSSLAGKEKELSEIYELINNNSIEKAEAQLKDLNIDDNEGKYLSKIIEVMRLLNKSEVSNEDYKEASNLYEEIKVEEDLNEELNKLIDILDKELGELSAALKNEKEIVKEALTLVSEEKYARAKSLLNDRFNFVTDYKGIAHMLAFKSDFEVLTNRHKNMDDVDWSKKVEERRKHRQTLLEHMEYTNPNLNNEMIEQAFIEALKEDLQEEYVDINADVWEEIYDGDKSKLVEARDDFEEIEYENKLKETPPQIGMTDKEVRLSSWGEPKKVNTTTTQFGVSEQWVYSMDRYIYLEDGIVVTIQD